MHAPWGEREESGRFFCGVQTGLVACLSHRGREMIGLAARRAERHGRGWITGPVGLLHWALYSPQRAQEEPVDILKIGRAHV